MPSHPYEADFPPPPSLLDPGEFARPYPDCPHRMGCLAVRTLHDAAEQPQGEACLDALLADRPQAGRQLGPADLPLPPELLIDQARLARQKLSHIFPCGSSCPLPDDLRRKVFFPPGSPDTETPA